MNQNAVRNYSWKMDLEDLQIEDGDVFMLTLAQTFFRVFSMSNELSFHRDVSICTKGTHTSQLPEAELSPMSDRLYPLKASGQGNACTSGPTGITKCIQQEC